MLNRWAEPNQLSQPGANALRLMKVTLTPLVLVSGWNQSILKRKRATDRACFHPFQRHIARQEGLIKRQALRSFLAWSQSWLVVFGLFRSLFV